jgi:hypothetical protein
MENLWMCVYTYFDRVAIRRSMDIGNNGRWAGL